MTKILPVIALAMMLSGCIEESSPKTAEKAGETLEKEAQQDIVKERQRTIEDAAEEATKLIEADAKSEVDELSRANNAE
jgi:PBP1b-binding outer membrane lipoprotein LpoB